MAIAIMATLGILFLVIYKHWEDDPMPGVASALCFLIFGAANFAVSGDDLTSIYFYLFLFGIGLFFAMLLEILVFSPRRASNKQKLQDNKDEKVDLSLSRMDNKRLKKGWHLLNRAK